MRALVSGAVVCVLLSACGVRAQDGPEQLPPGVLPSELRHQSSASATPSTGSTVTTVPVYLVEGSRLVREERPARRRSLEDALTALLTAGPQGARRSAVPPGTVVEGLTARGARVSIELSAPFAEVRGRDQVLAAAQVVWTATEHTPVREVELLVDGRRIELPVDEGEVTEGPAERRDYWSVRPAQR